MEKVMRRPSRERRESTQIRLRIPFSTMFTADAHIGTLLVVWLDEKKGGINYLFCTRRRRRME